MKSEPVRFYMTVVHEYTLALLLLNLSPFLDLLTVFSKAKSLLS